MIKKRIFALLLTTVMTMGCLTLTANAANTVDTGFKFTVSENTQYTESRVKETSTSTYVKIDQVPVQYVVCRVYGYIPSYATGTNEWKNETVGGSVSIGVGQWEVYQNVYEHKGRNAKLGFTRFSTNGICSGVWSPDCAGHYKVATK